MIEEVKMWCASCDICKENYELWSGCVALSEKSAIKDDILEAGEWSITEEGKTYCSDCSNRVWDDEGEKQYVMSKDTSESGAQLLGTAL